MAVAQVVDKSIPIPEIFSSNPVRGIFYLLSSVLKKNEAVNDPIFKQFNFFNALLDFCKNLQAHCQFHPKLILPLKQHFTFALNSFKSV